MGHNGPQVWRFLWQARFKTLGFFGKYKRCGFSDRSCLFRCRTSFASPLLLRLVYTLGAKSIKMQNEEGQITELYVPRKCSATNRMITSKDHASVQLNIGHLDADGIYTGQFTTFALCGFVRAQGDADSGVDRLWQKKKVEAKQI
ncbi:40S ribosomal protein S21-2 [Brassica rapa]|uniref:40S ribosomal protein S21-2 n=1 Tax=Brassica campestris TaxID=3711 RepID=UPI00142E3E9E|nr:40S ribosomal protein S21-2 [Brassica rapa]